MSKSTRTIAGGLASVQICRRILTSFIRMELAAETKLCILFKSTNYLESKQST